MVVTLLLYLGGTEKGLVHISMYPVATKRTSEVMPSSNRLRSLGTMPRTFLGSEPDLSAPLRCTVWSAD